MTDERTQLTLLAVIGYAVAPDPASAVDAAMRLADVEVDDVAVLVGVDVDSAAWDGSWWAPPDGEGFQRRAVPDGQPIAATLADAVRLLDEPKCAAVLMVSAGAALLVTCPDGGPFAYAQIATTPLADGADPTVGAALAAVAAYAGVALDDVTQLRIQVTQDTSAVIAGVAGGLGRKDRTCVLGGAGDAGVLALAEAVRDLHRAVLPATPSELRETASELPQPLCLTVSAQPWARRSSGGSRAAAIVATADSPQRDAGALHVVSSSCPAGDKLPLNWFGCGGPVVLVLHAASGLGLQAAASRIHDELSAGADLLALSLRSAREAPAHSGLRAVLLATSTAAMLAELDAARRHLAGRIAAGQIWVTPSGSFCTPHTIGPGAKVALVYPGTFAMYPGAEAGLCELFPALLAGAEVFESRPYHALAIADSYLRAARPPTADEIAAHTAALQSDLGYISSAGVYFGMLSTSMAQLLGIQPDGAFGYSLGEICMLWGMGVWEYSEETGRSMRESPLFTDELYGRRTAVRYEWNRSHDEDVWQTLALAAPADRVRQVVAGHDRVFVTHVNTPNEVVVAGDPTQCGQVAAELSCPHFPVPGGGPVLHVPLAARARESILAMTDHRLGTADAQNELFFASGRDVDLSDGDAIADAVLNMCCSEVDFPRLCQAAYDSGFRYFIEVGPGGDCTRWISANLRGQPHVAVSIDQRALPTAVAIARALAKLISAGLPVNIPYAGESSTPAPAGRPAGAEKTTVADPTPAPLEDTAASLLAVGNDLLEIADHHLVGLTAASVKLLASAHTAQPAGGATTDLTASVAPRPANPPARTYHSAPPQRRAPAAPALQESVSAIASGVARAHIAALNAQTALQHLAMDALMSGSPTPVSAAQGIGAQPTTLSPWAQVMYAVEQAAAHQRATVGGGHAPQSPLVWDVLHLTWHGRPQVPAQPPRADLTVRPPTPGCDSGSAGVDFAITGTLDVDRAALVDVEGRAGLETVTACPVLPAPTPRSARAARARGFKPIERTSLVSLTGEQILLLARGDYAGVYGARWQQPAGVNPRVRIADPEAALLSSVDHIDVRGGPFRMGALRAVRNLSAGRHTDVSPAAVALDAAEQLLRIYAVHLGLHLVFNDAELVPAEAIQVGVSTGAPPAAIDHLVLDAVVVEVTMVPRPTIVADVSVRCGNTQIVALQGVAVQVRERPGSIFRPELRNGAPVYLGRCNTRGEPVWLNEFHLSHLENGEHRVAMGPLFDTYTGRTLLYIPNGEFRLVDRINAVKEANASLRGGQLTVEYDVHPDSWFFEDNSFDGIPASMVMESSLQAAAVTGVCMGTTTIAPPDEKLSVRNLDGTATFLADLDPRGKTWVQETTLLSTTHVLRQVLQRFSYRITLDDVPYYEGTSLFGYFTDQALASQVGLDSGVDVPRWIDKGGRRSELDVIDLDLTDEGLQLHPTLRPGSGYLHLVDHATIVKSGGRHGLGYLAGERRVSPGDWYFDCHFHTDPVMPGSLGVEAVQQGLQIFALAAGLADGPETTFAVPTGVPFTWTYRGQILRDEPRLMFELDVTDIRETSTGLLLLADASVFKPGMRIYHFTGVALEIRGTRSCK
jgi:3-hydroxymyristoyl/3-hydroxydecanoyl-(acyl carrier protein) dehydratase/malonyl CoA-acyl carrier protein transacylase